MFPDFCFCPHNLFPFISCILAQLGKFKFEGIFGPGTQTGFLPQWVLKHWNTPWRDTRFDAIKTKNWGIQRLSHAVFSLFSRTVIVFNISIPLAGILVFQQTCFFFVHFNNVWHGTDLNLPFSCKIQKDYYFNLIF